jgi:hypothetical protein
MGPRAFQPKLNIGGLYEDLPDAAGGVHSDGFQCPVDRRAGDAQALRDCGSANALSLQQT